MDKASEARRRQGKQKHRKNSKPPKRPSGPPVVPASVGSSSWLVAGMLECSINSKQEDVLALQEVLSLIGHVDNNCWNFVDTGLFYLGIYKVPVDKPLLELHLPRCAPLPPPPGMATTLYLLLLLCCME